MSLKITNFRLQPNLPGASVLIYVTESLINNKSKSFQVLSDNKPLLEPMLTKFKYAYGFIGGWW